MKKKERRTSDQNIFLGSPALGRERLDDKKSSLSTCLGPYVAMFVMAPSPESPGRSTRDHQTKETNPLQVDTYRSAGEPPRGRAEVGVISAAASLEGTKASSR